MVDWKAAHLVGCWVDLTVVPKVGKKAAQMAANWVDSTAVLLEQRLAAL